MKKFLLGMVVFVGVVALVFAKTSKEDVKLDILIQNIEALASGDIPPANIAFDKVYYEINQVWDPDIYEYVSVSVLVCKDPGAIKCS